MHATNPSEVDSIVESIVESVAEEFEDLSSFLEAARKPTAARPGRPAVLTASEVFGETAPISTADLADYHSRLTAASPEHHLKCLTDIDALSWRQHRIAQLLALGDYTIKEIAEIIKITPQTISYLKRSPVFCDLVASYQADVFEEDKAVQHKARAIRDGALDELDNQIREGKMRGKDLAYVTFGLMDRTGHGPSKTVNNHSTNVDIPSDMIAEIRREHDDRRSRIIDVTPIGDAGGDAEKEALSGRTPMGQIVGQLPVAPPSSEESDSSASGGTGVREQGREIVKGEVVETA